MTQLMKHKRTTTVKLINREQKKSVTKFFSIFYRRNYLVVLMQIEYNFSCSIDIIDKNKFSFKQQEITYTFASAHFHQRSIKQSKYYPSFKSIGMKNISFSNILLLFAAKISQNLLFQVNS
jgi:hypothetical protein